MPQPHHHATQRMHDVCSSLRGHPAAATDCRRIVTQTCVVDENRREDTHYFLLRVGDLAANHSATRWIRQRDFSSSVCMRGAQPSPSESRAQQPSDHLARSWTRGQRLNTGRRRRGFRGFSKPSNSPCDWQWKFSTGPVARGQALGSGSTIHDPRRRLARTAWATGIRLPPMVLRVGLPRRVVLSLARLAAGRGHSEGTALALAPGMGMSLGEERVGRKISYCGPSAGPGWLLLAGWLIIITVGQAVSITARGWVFPRTAGERVRRPCSIVSRLRHCAALCCAMQCARVATRVRRVAPPGLRRAGCRDGDDGGITMRRVMNNV